MKPGTPGFVGERLREAREARGFTANALAVPLGVTPAAVSQYEKEIQTPRPDVMQKIVDVLDLPLSFFTRKVQRERGVVFWRSLMSATKLSRLAAERRLEWVQDIAGVLRSHLEIPATNLPTVDLPRDPIAIDDDLIERAAEAARRFWRLGDEPIESATRLLESNGVVMAREDLQTATLDALAKWCPDTGNAYCLVSSGKSSAARARFNVLHELAHLVLHRQLDRWHLLNSGLHPVLEDQAMKFAGAFGMPAESFAPDVYSLSLDAFIELKAKWKLSIQAMIMRCEALGMLNEETRQRLWRGAASRGWRVDEPLDDEIAPEHPALLAEGIQALLSDRTYTWNSLADTLTIRERDIEELASLPRRPVNVASIPIPTERPTTRASGQRARVVAFPKP